MHLRAGLSAILTLLSVLLTSAAPANEKLPVFVSILPQKYFAEKIGGNLVNVSTMVKPGASPATYEPKPRQMSQISKSKIYFAIGVPFENAWLKKIAAINPGMLLVHTDEGIKKIPMPAHLHADEDYSEKTQHPEHGSLDPHIWLSPPLVKIQAQHILQAFLAVDPVHRSQYEENYSKFLKEIDAIHAELKHILSGQAGFRFMVFHPSWGYFADTYGLEQVAIEIEGKNPKPAQLKGLINHAETHGIKVILAQPQFSTKSADLIAKEIGGKVVFVDPLAEDWSANLREVAVKLKSALR
jgi:zinc transport system substrate-binding protein